MRINRSFLYAGVFLLALGAVLVAADLETLDLGIVRDALRLWPIAIVLIGVAIVVRRSRAALPLGLLAAGAPGLVLGGAFAVGPRFITDCGDTTNPTPGQIVREGTFDGPATVSIEISCGSIVVTTAAGSAWQLDAANTRNRIPAVAATSGSLRIDDPGADGWPNLDIGRNDWQLTLPTSELRELSVTANASDGRLDLAGAQLDTLQMTANASQVRLDLTTTTVRELHAKANLSSMAIDLPGSVDLVGDLKVNAGQLRLCVPAGAGLRIAGRGVAAGFEIDGADRTNLNMTYQSSDYATATHHIDLTVNASLGAVQINPIGGCK